MLLLLVVAIAGLAALIALVATVRGVVLRRRVLRMPLVGLLTVPLVRRGRAAIAVASVPGIVP